MTTASKKTWQLTAITEALGDLQLTVDKRLTIGRGQDNDVVLGSKQVSRQHAELLVNDNELLVQDLGSSNGTLINDAKLEPNTPTALSEDDVVTFAAFSFRVKEVPHVTPASTTAPIASETKSSEPKPSTEVVDANEKEPLVKETGSDVDTAKQAEENAEALEKADIKNMNKQELEKELEQELEEPIAFGDPDQKQPAAKSDEYYDELAAEADPEVHKSKQAASAQMSATTNIHEEVDQTDSKETKTTETKPVEPEPKAETTAPIDNEAPNTLDNLEKTKVKEEAAASFNTVNEQSQHNVAHVNNTNNINHQPQKSSRGWFWLILILVVLAIAMWLYNSGMGA